MSYGQYLKKLEDALESAKKLENEFDRAQTNITHYEKLQKKASKELNLEFFISYITFLEN